MNADVTVSRLLPILRRVFSNPSLTVTRATTAADVPGWDSLNNLFLSMEIETEFGCDLSADEISRSTNLGALADLILQKHRSLNEGQS